MKKMERILHCLFSEQRVQLFYRDGEHFCLPAPSDPSLLRLIIGVLHRLPSDVHTYIYGQEQECGTHPGLLPAGFSRVK